MNLSAIELPRIPAYYPNFNMHDFTDIIHTFIGFVYTVMHARFKNNKKNK